MDNIKIALNTLREHTSIDDLNFDIHKHYNYKSQLILKQIYNLIAQGYKDNLDKSRSYIHFVDYYNDRYEITFATGIKEPYLNEIQTTIIQRYLIEHPPQTE